LENVMNMRRKSATILGCTLCSALLVPYIGWSDEPAHEPGTWAKHEYSFVYLGFTATYSCDGLADKLKLLLIAAGARPDSKAHAGACAQGYGSPDKFARADLTFYTLVPGGSNAGSENKPVDGHWRAVSIAEHSPWDLRTGDCEVVEQFRNVVLPMFATRNLDDRTTCIPHQLSGSNISLRFETFAAVPAPHAAPAKAGGS
jgi:hypothetical protein